MKKTVMLVALALAATSLEAQSVADRAARIENGVLRLSFASRPGVCGNGSSWVRLGDGSRRSYVGEFNFSTKRQNEWEEDECESGPVRVALTIEDRAPVSVRVYVGGNWRPGGDAVTDLGMVSAPQATEYLMSVAERSGTGKTSSKTASNAIFGAVLADSVTLWPRLMRMARDESRAREPRRQAVFWLSQAAGDAATAGLDTLVGDARLDREVREHAVFALSQRPKDEGVPALLRIARSNRDPEIRRKAIFWLGQSEDPRALALFEDLLGNP